MIFFLFCLTCNSAPNDADSTFKVQEEANIFSYLFHYQAGPNHQLWYELFQ